MANFNCSKCGSQSLEWKEGVSKTTGNRWTAWNCPDCKIMHGMNGKPWAAKGSKPNFAPRASNSEIQPSYNPVQTASDDMFNRILAQINTKLDKIISLLGKESDVPF